MGFILALNWKQRNAYLTLREQGEIFIVHFSQEAISSSLLTMFMKAFLVPS